jgi:hypothetical protein
MKLKNGKKTMSYEIREFTQDDWMGYAGAGWLPNKQRPYLKPLLVSGREPEVIGGDVLICGEDFGDEDDGKGIWVSFNLWNEGEIMHCQREVKTLEVALSIVARLPAEFDWDYLLRFLDVYGFPEIELC